MITTSENKFIEKCESSKNGIFLFLSSLPLFPFISQDIRHGTHYGLDRRVLIWKDSPLPQFPKAEFSLDAEFFAKDFMFMCAEICTHTHSELDPRDFFFLPHPVPATDGRLNRKLTPLDRSTNLKTQRRGFRNAVLRRVFFFSSFGSRMYFYQFDIEAHGLR